MKKPKMLKKAVEGREDATDMIVPDYVYTDNGIEFVDSINSFQYNNKEYKLKELTGTSYNVQFSISRYMKVEPDFVFHIYDLQTREFTYRKAKDLKLGDYVIHKDEIKPYVNKNNKINKLFILEKDFLYFYGLTLRNLDKLNKKNNDFVIKRIGRFSYIDDILNKIDPDFKHDSISDKFTVTHPRFRKLFKRFHINYNDKVLKEWLFTLDKEAIIDFLSGYAEGHIKISEFDGGLMSTSNNLDNMLKIALLFRLVGIECTVLSRPRRHYKGRLDFQYYHKFTSEGVQNFYNIIKFKIPSNKKKISRRPRKLDRSTILPDIFYQIQKGLEPTDKNILRPIFHGYSKHKWFKALYGYSANIQKALTRNSFKKIYYEQFLQPNLDKITLSQEFKSNLEKYYLSEEYSFMEVSKIRIKENDVWKKVDNDEPYSFSEFSYIDYIEEWKKLQIKN
jgi:hypothetical protein